MKKLNITKKQYAESKYFNQKYGSLKYVSESGKLYKTDKGVVLALEETEPEVQDESLSDIGDAIKKTGGEMVDKVKGAAKKVGKAIGDKIHGIYRKGDRVTLKGQAGEVEGAVTSASPDKVVIRPDNEREFDESSEDGVEEVTRGELTEMMKDVVAEVEKVCDAQDLSFEEVIGVEPEGEADEADADEVVATSDEVGEALAGVIDAVQSIADKADVELPVEVKPVEDDEEEVDESLADIGAALKKTGGEMVDKVKSGAKKVGKAIGDKIHGIYRKGDRVELKGKAGEITGAVTSASPDEVVIRPDNEREFDEGDECQDGACECGNKPALESRLRARKVRESIRRCIRARKVMEARAKARKARILESLRKRRAAKRMMESRKARRVVRKSR